MVCSDFQKKNVFNYPEMANSRYCGARVFIIISVYFDIAFLHVYIIIFRDKKIEHCLKDCFSFEWRDEFKYIFQYMAIVSSILPAFILFISTVILIAFVVEKTRKKSKLDSIETLQGLRLSAIFQIRRQNMQLKKVIHAPNLVRTVSTY